MVMDVYKVINEMDFGELIDAIAPYMDDYLYIMDLQKNTFRTSQPAAICAKYLMGRKKITICSTAC